MFLVKTSKSRSLAKNVAPLSNEQALNVIYGPPGRNEMKCLMVDSVNVCHPCGSKFGNQSQRFDAESLVWTSMMNSYPNDDDDDAKSHVNA